MLHDARIVAQHHQGRPAVAGHPHQVFVEARFLQDAVVHRERRAAAPEHRIRQHFEFRGHSLQQGNGHHIHRRRLPGRRPKARNRQADGGGRKAALPRARRAGAVQHHRSGEHQFAGEVAPPGPGGRVRARHTQRAHHATVHLHVGHEPPVGVHHQPLIQRSAHRRRLYSHRRDSASLPIPCAPERRAQLDRRSGESAIRRMDGHRQRAALQHR